MRGFLRDWPRRSDMTDNGLPRTAGQEFMYTLSDGRWASGRARRRAMGMGMGGMERGIGRGIDPRMRSSSAPPGSAALRPQPPGPNGIVGGHAPGNDNALAGPGRVVGQGLGGSQAGGVAPVQGGLRQRGNWGGVGPPGSRFGRGAGLLRGRGRGSRL